eukprot:TRINITY_DN31582_c0_g2_i1.p1 TRINITY_DN31582_c0_g2~~TRINITY_DN31582_c0_g2_i1.p1  ORF type:complete len:173 (+),score=17.92 TRINITY_DN31582_c0_g2_i1:436-954(+)
MAAHQAAFAAEQYPLSGFLARNTFEEVGEDEYRRYGGLLVSVAISKSRDVDRKRVDYMLGPRHRTKAKVFRNLCCHDRKVMLQRIEINEALHQQSSFHVGLSCRQADLSAVLFRLGSALAFYSNWGELSTQLMRGGQPVDCVHSRTFCAVMSRKNVVFVPPQVACFDCPAAF